MISLSQKALQYLNMARVALIARRAALSAGGSVNTKQIQEIDDINDALVHLAITSDLVSRGFGIEDEFQYELVE